MSFRRALSDFVATYFAVSLLSIMETFRITVTQELFYQIKMFASTN